MDSLRAWIKRPRVNAAGSPGPHEHEDFHNTRGLGTTSVMFAPQLEFYQIPCINAYGSMVPVAGATIRKTRASHGDFTSIDRDWISFFTFGKPPDVISLSANCQLTGVLWNSFELMPCFIMYWIGWYAGRPSLMGSRLTPNNYSNCSVSTCVASTISFTSSFYPLPWI